MISEQVEQRRLRKSRPCSSTTVTSATPGAARFALDSTEHQISLTAEQAQAPRDALARSELLLTFNLG
jgi:hypothetical protein